MNLLDNALRIFTGALMVALVIIMVAQVFWRYVLNSSLFWSEEVAVYLMIWVVFLGAAILVRTWDHVLIQSIVEALPKGPRTVAILFSRIASIVCIAVFFWYGVEAFLGNFHPKSSGLGISTRWVKLVIPIGAALMLVNAFAVFLADISALLRGGTSRFEMVTPQSSESVSNSED